MIVEDDRKTSRRVMASRFAYTSANNREKSHRFRVGHFRGSNMPESFHFIDRYAGLIGSSSQFFIENGFGTTPVAST